VRPRAGIGGRLAQADIERLLPGAALRFGDPTDGTWLRRENGRPWPSAQEPPRKGQKKAAHRTV